MPIRIQRGVVKRLLAVAMNAAVGTDLRLKSEVQSFQADQAPESNRRFTVRMLTLDGLPRRNAGEGDMATITLEVAVAVSSSKTYADGDDAIDEAIDALAAALDKPGALIDADTSTRVELSRMSSRDEPAGENAAEGRAVVTVSGRVIRTA